MFRPASAFQRPQDHRASLQVPVQFGLAASAGGALTGYFSSRRWAPVPSFATVAEAAAHFKRLHETRVRAGISGDLAGVGEQCVLTGGQKENDQVRSRFWVQGVRASVRGPQGKRRITVRSFKEEYVTPRR